MAAFELHGRAENWAQLSCAFWVGGLGHWVLVSDRTTEAAGACAFIAASA